MPDDRCSEKGNSLVAYYDKLAKSISMNQLSETEARELFLKRNCWSCNRFFHTYEIKNVNTYNHFTVMDDYWYSDRNIDSSKYICYLCLQN